jgi:exportin-7
MDPSSLSALESLCSALYSGRDETERQHAQKQLMEITIPQCQYILDHSQSSYALFVASNSLTRLVTQYWNNFSVPQRVEMRNYTLGYLANQGPQIPEFVATALIQLVRMCKCLLRQSPACRCGSRAALGMLYRWRGADVA